MSKESNVEKTLHDKVKSLTDDLAGQMITLENKYHHREISFDKYIEMGELYSKLNTEAVEALIASEVTRHLEDLKNQSDYDDDCGEYVPIDFIEEKINYMIPKGHPDYWKYHCVTCGKWTGHEMEDMGDDYCECE